MSEIREEILEIEISGYPLQFKARCLIEPDMLNYSVGLRRWQIANITLSSLHGYQP